ncbi:hypothetical protein KIH41_04500 [Litoribacter ruber]|uniref:hypothetical protein n=1 Tax=Litoribacter ruber TaxID=702568 RepID=UPI001BDB2426|nr:hypothetical protein [Litoribacter ruber]MBT0810533.1 hypothetical protein [Litoribacter ruber]
MSSNTFKHTFHIPVMGIGFTIDTPIRVAPYGISSAMSLVDDMLIERMREFYSEKMKVPFEAITKKVDDFRAKRITAYLNLVDELVDRKFQEIKDSFDLQEGECEKYLRMLPSSFQEQFKQLLASKGKMEKQVWDWAKQQLVKGSIDVNIMTKLDKDNYVNDEKLPVEFNDAHAALRGYALSNLENSSIILSAGMNPRLYSYLEKFEDFFPDEEGKLKKKVTLKVSDFRSAMIQGKFLAKKGIWVSEYRIESGLNCGGHAFATDGYLMGPILEEFKSKRAELIDTTWDLLTQTWEKAGRSFPAHKLPLKVTAQGGVGTSEEHEFLMKEYNLDSIGWGTPFLLVPEAVSIDEPTMELLSNAKEDDLYLSNISPLGVPFNNIKGNTEDIEKQRLIDKGRPGSSCPKKYASLDTEFTEKVICTASRQYQQLKLKQLEVKELEPAQYQKAYDKITDKACICKALGTAALVEKGMETKKEGSTIAICPGPNMAYYSGKRTLEEMADYIYGRGSIGERKDRPFIFVKELTLYVNYLKDKLSELEAPITSKQAKYFADFEKNLQEGIAYYHNLLSRVEDNLGWKKEVLFKAFEELGKKIDRLDLSEVKI